MITVPFSLELARDEDAISIVEGTLPDPVALKMKIFLGANVNPGLPQTYIGSLKAVYRHMMNERFKSTASALPGVGFGDWQSAGAANIEIDAGVGSVTADDVGISVAGNFETEAATHFYTETFNQLINGLLERVSDN